MQLREMAAIVLLGMLVCVPTSVIFGAQDSLAILPKHQEETVAFDIIGSLTADKEHLCHIVVYRTGVDTANNSKPEQVVVYDYAGNRDGQILWQCYRNNVFLEKSGLLQYYSVTKIELADIDDDGINEVIISWDSDCVGSGWIRTLEVLNYNPQTREFTSYRGLTTAGPFGGFQVIPLDPAGKAQRVFAYSYVNDGMNGEECRWCPHRYRIAVYTLTKDGLVIDPHWNNGEVAYTQVRFTSDEYDTLSKYYIRSALYNTFIAGSPFVVLSPQPWQPVSLPFSLRVEIPQYMQTLGIKVLSTSSDGMERVLLDDVIDGWAYKPSTSLKVEDSIYYTAPNSSLGRILLYDPAHPDNQAHTLSIPITFLPVSTTTVRVYYPNRNREVNQSGEVLLYPVERRIPKTGDIVKAALIQLFRGPTASEKRNGFFTYLIPVCNAQDAYYPMHPCSNKIANLEIKNGTARVWLYDIDWDAIIYTIGGIRSLEAALRQIRETILQFPGISRVIIW